MSRAIRDACFVVALVFSSLVATPAFALPALASTVPASLAGEVLQASGPGGATACSPSVVNPSVSVSFFYSGGAVGPYTGTFTESGTASWNGYAGQLVTFHADFTIVTTSVTIIGTKDFVANISGGYTTALGSCSGTNLFWLETNATYAAIIGGAFSDSGTATAFVYCGRGCDPLLGFGFATETFHASNGVQPLAPTSKDQCKDGNWQGYSQFKNQGDCVNFVVNGK